ncbi:MAG TPA: prepilin-type N-terminal cleavage/methylation domain-containing protein [Polyangia bacterium]|jgi:prepilin-type N-terminal cleavage/methylation domain-containing protein|nr:prepilin-type N-terminal cleavage/methylation domain-containing protein [Polyangia bacterium]
MRAADRSGFTLVELMIVVVIIGILAAIGAFGYRTWISRARSGEAIAVLAEMNSKEQSYKLEFATYLPLRADNKPDLPSPDEAAGAFYPLDASSATFDSTRTATSIADPTLWPQGWQAVGLRPRDTSLYCTYLTNAGSAGNDTKNLKFGSVLIGNNTAAPWFYSLGVCNLSPTTGYPDEVSVFALSSLSPTLRVFNEGK